MKRQILGLTPAALSLGLAGLLATPAHAAFVVAGSLQDEHGDPADWTPSTSSLIMAWTDSSPNLTHSRW